MPNLNDEAKLITPGQAVFFVILGLIFSVWYWDVDVMSQLENAREAVRTFTGGVL